jgi:predicted MFS family arabinose efflux permease
MRQLALLASLLRRNPAFRRLFLAVVVSLLGDWFSFVAVSGFIVERTGRPGLAAVVYAASVLPIFFLSPVAGVFADRWDRRRLMVGADLLRVVPVLGLLVALWQGSAALAIACVVLLSAISAFFEPAAAAATPNLVEPEDLPIAQAAMGAVWGTMLFVGAAVGGVVTAGLGREASIVIDAASFVVSALLLAGIRRPFRVRTAPHDSMWGHLREVWRFVRSRKLVRALLVTKTGVGVGNGIVGLLPAYALARFGAGDAGIGALLAARGLGALLGPFVASRFVVGDGRRLVLVCGASILTYSLAYTFLPLAASIPLALLCVTLAHLGGGAQWVLSTYGLQVATPDEVRGRVLSVDYGAATFAIGLSALAAGGAAEVVGLEATSWGLAGIGLIYGVAWLWWTRDLWRAADDPLRGPESGPPG